MPPIKQLSHDVDQILQDVNYMYTHTTETRPTQLPVDPLMFGSLVHPEDESVEEH